MVVFLSDVHMTDGSSGETIKPTALRIFAENIRKPADTVKPLEEIRLYILEKRSSYQFRFKERMYIAVKMFLIKSYRDLKHFPDNDDQKLK